MTVELADCAMDAMNEMDYDVCVLVCVRACVSHRLPVIPQFISNLVLLH